MPKRRKIKRAKQALLVAPKKDRKAAAKRAWATRRARMVTNAMRDTGVAVEGSTALLEGPPPLRAQILDAAKALTLGDRNKSYGDPYENFEAISALKRAFWGAMSYGNNDPHFPQNSPWGHAIDMVLMNLGRIASAPTVSAALAEDRYKDGVNYLAIALEVARRDPAPTAEP